MASSFDRVVKYLDLRRASKDTTENTKPLTLVRGRVIKKLQDTLTLPAHTYNIGQVFGYPVPRLLFQYNVTVGYEFSLTYIAGAYTKFGQLYVKWREGTTVFRYRLNVDDPLIVSPDRLAQQNVLYTNQRIKSNCVFEFWLTSTTPTAPMGLTSPLILKLSRLRNPVTADDLGSNANAAEALEIADLGVAIPEDLPYNQANIAWLDNP